jgi:uncharacterized protein (TIGR02246 family)
MKKKIALLLSGVMLISLLAACGAKPAESKPTTESATPTTSEVSLDTGSVTIYDYGDTKLHVFSSGDALGDVAYIVEGASALVGIELPGFTDGLDAWKAYIKKLDKPMNDIFLCDHVTGASYVAGMNIYGTQGAKDSIAAGTTYATTEGLYQTLGDDFHGGPEIAYINKVVSGTGNVAGIDFNLIDHGETYDLEIPSLNVIYTHMLGKTSHSIITSTEHADAMLAALKSYQDAGYDMILTSHGGPEKQDAVTEKITYVEKVKELAASSSNAEAFTSAMKEAFPDYTGENYLDMTASYLFPSKEAVDDATAIRALMTSYRNALALSDPEAVVANYTTDGVVMGPGSPTAIGEDLDNTYTAIFSNVGLNLDFTVANMVIGDKYAVVQSTSDGTALVNATGNRAPEQNRELFVMEKVDGTWKIARYMYNKMDVLAPADSMDVVENTTTGSTTEDETQVRKLITTTYRDALAASDAGAVANVFAIDGVVMPPEGATYRGRDAVKSNYEGVFGAVALDLQFSIDEVVLDGDYGFVRSTSDGTAKVLATGESGPEVNRELWVVHKEDGVWKIAFYMYNKMS